MGSKKPMFPNEWLYYRPCKSHIVHESATVEISAVAPASNSVFDMITLQTKIDEYLVVHAISLLGYQQVSTSYGSKWEALEPPFIHEKLTWDFNEKKNNEFLGSFLYPYDGDSKTKGVGNLQKLSVANSDFAPLVLPPSSTALLTVTVDNMANGVTISPLNGRLVASVSGYRFSL